jgi:hypothetical protein
MNQHENREMDAVLNLTASGIGTGTLPDKLLWRDKLPLALALVAQSYVVFLWYLRSTHGVHPYVDFLVALAAGIALDWLTVSTVMGRREGRTSIWSWLTSFGAFIGSAMIAYDTYAAHWWPIDGQALLHICFPLVVLLYSLHLAAPKQAKQQAVITRVLEQEALPGDSRGHGEASSVVVAPAASNSSYFCPACGSSLENIGELGAAKRWGHCRHCKVRTTTLLTSLAEQNQNGASSE